MSQEPHRSGDDSVNLSSLSLPTDDVALMKRARTILNTPVGLKHKLKYMSQQEQNQELLQMMRKNRVFVLPDANIKAIDKLPYFDFLEGSLNNNWVP